MLQLSERNITSMEKIIELLTKIDGNQIALNRIYEFILVNANYFGWLEDKPCNEAHLDDVQESVA